MSGGVCMHKGQVILLNGTSSAGKSTILKEFQKLGNEYTILKVDDWFPEQVKKKAQELGWQEETSQDPWLFLCEYLHQKTGNYYFATEVRQELFGSSPAFFNKARDLSFAGQNVIIDTVLEYEQEYEKLFSIFKDPKPIMILVYCPMDILLHRVEQRNALGIVAEERVAFQSFEQFPALFKVQEHLEEQVVDHIQSVVMKKALDESIAWLIEHALPSGYVPKLEAFRKQFVEQFKLDDQDSISLVAKHRYDLVLQSGAKSPHELAQEMQGYLKMHT